MCKWERKNRKRYEEERKKHLKKKELKEKNGNITPVNVEGKNDWREGEKKDKKLTCVMYMYIFPMMNACIHYIPQTCPNK